MPTPLIIARPNAEWRNKHSNVSAKPATFYDVFNLWAHSPVPARSDVRPGIQGLRAIVAEAERTGKRVRAHGGGWSLSEAAVCGDIMVNTKPLNYVELGLKESSLDAAFRGDRNRLCFTQCGASVMELYRHLEPRGFTLPTGGASNGQTIAGAVSTGTHGAAAGFGSMQDYVVGLHLIVDGGKHYWIERASRPVVSRAFCEILGAELRRDDALFDAAVVSFGSFGLLHALLLEVEPLYLLERRVVRRDYPAVRRSLESLDVGSLGFEDGHATPFHYEVIIHPYRTGAGEGGARIRYMYKRPLVPNRPAAAHGGLIQGDDAMGFLGGITTALPGAVPIILDQILGALDDTPMLLATPGQQFGPTEIRGSIMSTEIGVPLSHGAAAVDAVIAVAQQFPWAGFPAVRFVKASAATLAFTHFAPVTCTIEIPSAGSDRTKQAFERIWIELHRRNIPFTLHWGQCMRSAAMHYETAYGARIERWQSARCKLLTPTGQHLFSSDWLSRCSLC